MTKHADLDEGAVLPPSELARIADRDRLVDPIYWDSAFEGSVLCRTMKPYAGTTLLCTRERDHAGDHACGVWTWVA